MAEQITPGYRTAIVFNKFGDILTQPLFSYQRKAPEMARGEASKQSEVQYVPGIGVQMRAHQSDPAKVYELTSALGGHLLGALVNVPSSVTMAYTARAESYSGVTYSGVASQSQPMYSKQVTAGTSWADGRLSSDEAAFPGPDKSSDPVDLDRVLVTVQNHDPVDQLSFMFHVPGSPGDRAGAIAVCYFSGPAGSTKDTERGLGQYALKLHVDGLATLWERKYDFDSNGAVIEDPAHPGQPLYSWIKRWEFIYSPVPAADMAYYITVMTDLAKDSFGNHNGSRMVFRTLSSVEWGGDGKTSDILNAYASQLSLQVSARKPFHIYNVPQAVVRALQEEKIRVDVRRNVRAAFMPMAHTYPDLSVLVEDPFTLPFHPNGVEPLRIEWYGPRPTGTNITMKLYRVDTGAEVTGGTIIFDDEFGQVIEYTVPVDIPAPRTYQLKFTFEGPGSKTARITEYRVYRSAVTETPGFTVKTIQDNRSGSTLPTLFPARVEVSGNSDDPETESMTIVVEDLLGSDLTLPFRTGTPIDIELRNPATDALKTIIAGGIISQSSEKRYYAKTGGYPNQDSYQLEIIAAGEWAQVKRKLLPFWFSAQDPLELTKPIKATDAVKWLFNEGCGIPIADLDIPDLPVRLFIESGGEDLLSIEPGSLCFESIREIVSDYTSHYIVRDKNAGSTPTTRGMWRLLDRHRPPYNNLFQIYRNHPGSGKVPHMLGAYPNGSGAGGQVIQATFAIRDESGPSEVISREPPEGNFVQVFGGSGTGSSVGGLHPGMLTQVAFNPVSFNYFGLAPSDDHYPDEDSPDFLGELVQIQVYDATLTTQQAVDWVCRRVFDSACFGREVVRLKVPLILVTDVNDTLQQRPRIPRFNDPCLYQQPDGTWAQYLVAKCSPSWHYDGYIVLNLEIVTTSNINTYGLPVGAFDYFDLSRARIRASKAASGVPGRSRATRSRQREFRVLREITGWPASTPTEIQYMDPGEPTFGQFKYMVDYDPVP